MSRRTRKADDYDGSDPRYDVDVNPDGTLDHSRAVRAICLFERLRGEGKTHAQALDLVKEEIPVT